MFAFSVADVVDLPAFTVLGCTAPRVRAASGGVRL